MAKIYYFSYLSIFYMYIWIIFNEFRKKKLLSKNVDKYRRKRRPLVIKVVQFRQPGNHSINKSSDF